MTRSIGGVWSMAACPQLEQTPLIHWIADQRREKSKSASKPGHCSAIMLISGRRQASCRTLLLHWPYHQLVTKQEGMFNLSHSLFIVPLLLQLVLSVTTGVSTRGGMRIKNSHIKDTFKSTTPKTISSNIHLTPSWVYDEAPVNTSTSMGRSSGSMQTSLQTSVGRLAVRSLISLCQMEGKPPLVYDRACLMENVVPCTSTYGGSLQWLQDVAESQGILERHVCVERNQIPGWGGRWAKKKSISLGPSPWNTVKRLREIVSRNLHLAWIVHASFCGHHLWLLLAHE